ncbi:MAG: hypothetical protein J0L73_01380 [Verrucomicrobia bacterium]|nr:hypothetical protein [Verrucomicrobiota bacterium]
MKLSIPTATGSFKRIARLASAVVAFPIAGLADLRIASEPPPPPTPLDARNAFVAFIVQSLLLTIALTALAWLLWWGVRMRRK